MAYYIIISKKKALIWPQKLKENLMVPFTRICLICFMLKIFWCNQLENHLNEWEQFFPLMGFDVKSWNHVHSGRCFKHKNKNFSRFWMASWTLHSFWAGGGLMAHFRAISNKISLLRLMSWILKHTLGLS